MSCARAAAAASPLRNPFTWTYFRAIWSDQNEPSLLAARRPSPAPSRAAPRRAAPRLPVALLDSHLRPRPRSAEPPRHRVTDRVQVFLLLALAATCAVAVPATTVVAPGSDAEVTAPETTFYVCIFQCDPNAAGWTKGGCQSQPCSKYGDEYCDLGGAFSGKQLTRSASRSARHPLSSTFIYAHALKDWRVRSREVYHYKSAGLRSIRAVRHCWWGPTASDHGERPQDNRTGPRDLRIPASI